MTIRKQNNLGTRKWHILCLFQPGRTRWEDLPTMVSPVSLDSIPDVQVSEAVKCEEHGESTKVSAEQQSLSEVTEEQHTGMSYIIERLQTAICILTVSIPKLSSPPFLLKCASFRNL